MPLRPNPVSGALEQSDNLFLVGRRVTADTHLTQADQVVLVDAAARPVTVILPRASAQKWRAFVIVKVDAADHRVTIAGAGGSLVDGALSQTINGQWNGIQVWSDGTQWITLPGGGA